MVGEFKATIRCLVETVLPIEAVAIVFKSKNVVGVARSKGKRREDMWNEQPWQRPSRCWKDQETRIRREIGLQEAWPWGPTESVVSAQRGKGTS